MAILKPKKLRETSEKEMGERLKELKLELSKERASSEIGTVKNPGRIREIRRSIARVLHEQHRRETAKMQKSTRTEKTRQAARNEPVAKSTGAK